MMLGTAQTSDKRAVTQPHGGLAHPSPACQQNALTPPVTKADFVDCIDRCVRLLVAESKAALAVLEAAQAQLRSWLHSKTQVLDDGTPIDFALFDATILSIEERLPPGTGRSQAHLLHASRMLAESVYAKT